jgi:hypothetical protein
LETEFGILFLEVEDAAGLNGQGLLKGFRFSVGHAARDDPGENPRELARHGSDPFGHSQPTFHPTTILAKLVLAVAPQLAPATRVLRSSPKNSPPIRPIPRYFFARAESTLGTKSICRLYASTLDTTTRNSSPIL